MLFMTGYLPSWHTSNPNYVSDNRHTTINERQVAHLLVELRYIVARIALSLLEHGVLLDLLLGGHLSAMGKNR